MHKLTAEPGGVSTGLDRLGSAELGKAADLCVFDPATVAPWVPCGAPTTFPADEKESALTADQPVGMTHVPS